MVKQAQIINLSCDVQIFSTVQGCGKHNVNPAISTWIPLASLTISKGMPLASLTISNSEIFTKEGYDH